jgi:hypothetical protein
MASQFVSAGAAAGEVARRQVAGSPSPEASLRLPAWDVDSLNALQPQDLGRVIENGPIVEVARWTILSDCAKSVSSRSPYTSGHFARRGGLTKWGAGPVRHSRSPEGSRY